MEDFFFHISFDVSVHPDYEEAGRQPNTTLRLMLFETAPPALTSNLITLDLKDNNEATELLTITGGNDDDIFTRRHRFSKGFHVDVNGTLVSPCERPITHLYLGVQCLVGYQYSTNECAPRIDREAVPSNASRSHASSSGPTTSMQMT